MTEGTSARATNPAAWRVILEVSNMEKYFTKIGEFKERQILSHEPLQWILKAVPGPGCTGDDIIHSLLTAQGGTMGHSISILVVAVR